MSFDTLRVKVGRRPITIVELDLDACANVYGTAPCTAVLGTTGAQKCFNTFGSCQDAPNFSKTTKTYRFCDDSTLAPVGSDYLPCIQSVDIAPTQLDPKGLSVSASVTVTLKDFPHHDRGFDPYWADRGYTPQGTFFGKLRARNVYVVNRVMRVLTGYVDASGVHTRSRTYFIDHIEGPDSSGRVRIVGKDLLKFADVQDAQCPVPTKASLSADISSSVTSLTLTPSGAGADFPTSGVVRINDELISYSGKSTDTLTGLTRGYSGTTADSHDEDDKVQLCVVFEDASIPEILKTLLEDYASVDPSYIPYADWTTESDNWISDFAVGQVILSEPDGVKDLLKEVLEASGTALWWDEVAAELKFKVLVPLSVTNDVMAVDDNANILEGSMSIKDLESERISRVVVYFNPISPVGDVKEDNFRSISVTIDTPTEGANAYNSEKARTILNRWVPSKAVSDELADRLLNRYRVTPRQITFKLDAKDLTLNTGDLVDVSTRLIQKETGELKPLRYLVTETRESEIGSVVQYTAIQVDSIAGAVAYLITPDDQSVWTSATDEQKGKYFFISGDDGFMSDGTRGATIS